MRKKNELQATNKALFHSKSWVFVLLVSFDYGIKLPNQNHKSLTHLRIEWSNVKFYFHLLVFTIVRNEKIFRFQIWKESTWKNVKIHWKRIKPRWATPRLWRYAFWKGKYSSMSRKTFVSLPFRRRLVWNNSAPNTRAFQRPALETRIERRRRFSSIDVFSPILSNNSPPAAYSRNK